jgi:hypothetical protein
MLAADHSAFSTRLPLSQAVLVLLLGLSAFACTPKIGDSCTVSTNCSASGDRLCDITEPGGYCTIFNCEPGSCPDSSVCINFGTELSSVDQCSSSQGNSPYQRSFCMAPCSSDGDCRGGYSCQDLSGKPKADGSPGNALGAVLADNTGDGRVCAARAVSTPPGLELYDAGSAGSGNGGAPASNDVCKGTGISIPGLADGTSGTGGASSVGDSGAAGASGAASDAGAGG